MKKILLCLILLVSVYCRSTTLTKVDSGWNTLNTAQNDAPIVKITAPADGKKYNPGDQLEVTVDASDTDGKVISVEIYFQGSLVTVDTTSPYAFTLKIFDLTSGAVLKAIATDDKGLSSSDSVIVTVAFNELPIIVLSSPNPGMIVKENDLVLFEADASDPDGYITRVDFEVDGTVIGTSSVKPYRATWKATAGAATIIARAYDDDLYSQIDGVNLIINREDFCVDITKPAYSSVHAVGDVISIEATVKIPATKQIDNALFFVNDQLIAVDSVAPYAVNWTAQTGEAMVKVRVTSGAASAEDFIMIRVQDPAYNEPPVARIVEYYNGYLYGPDDKVHINASATDVDGKISAVEFFVNGSSIGVDSIAPFLLIWKAVKGLAVITVIATDNKGAKSQPSIPYQVYVDNKFPALRIKIIQPLTRTIYKTGDVVNIEIFNSGTSKVHYKRSEVDIIVNDVRIASVDTYPYKAQWIATKGKVVIKAISKNLLQNFVDSVIVTVEDNNSNIPPVIDIISPNKNSIANPGTPLFIDTKTADTDGTISSVSFFVNGTLIGVDNTAPYNINWTTSAGAANIKAVAKDNLGGEAADSVTIQVIQNTAPTIKITGLSNGQVVTANNSFFISVLVKDLVGKIDQVEFFVNDKSVGIDREHSYNALWTFPNGDARIRAIVTDDKGLTAVDSIKITVNVIHDSTEIKITSPITTLFYKVGDVIPIAAEVKPSFYKVDYVEFQINDSIHLFDSVAPYTTQWPTTNRGMIKINAIPVHLDSVGVAIPLAQDEMNVFVKQADFDVKITSPQPNGWFHSNHLMAIQTVADDSKNKVSHIEFFVEGVLVGIDHTFPYAAQWLTKKGTTLFRAVATNDIGEQVSDTVIIEGMRKYPEITIRKPLNGQEFSKGDPITIDADIETGKFTEEPPYHVEFFVNGKSIKMDSKVPFEAPYTAEWTAVSGYAVIKAVIWSTSSALPIADSVIIKVNDDRRPTIEITYPLNGAAFKPGDQIRIDAKALDTEAIVKAVSFFADGGLIGIDSVAPYAINWSTIKEGKVTLIAKAIDNSALVGISEPVEIISTTVSGISKSDTNNKILLYPNPASSVLTIESDENAILELLAVDGKQILLRKNVIAKQKQQINIEMIANGSYIVKVYNDQFSSFRKIIINK